MSVCVSIYTQAHTFSILYLAYTVRTVVRSIQYLAKPVEINPCLNNTHKKEKIENKHFPSRTSSTANDTLAFNIYILF